MKKYVVGVDVGTTGTKAIVADLYGRNLGSSYRDYPLIHPRPDRVELSAANLREQVVTVVGEAVHNSGVDPAEIASLSFSVQRSTFALVDEHGEALEDTFIVWLDQRGEEVLEEIGGLIDHDLRAQISGMPSVAIFAIVKYYWLKQHRPDLYQRAAFFASVDGYIMKQFGVDRFCNEVTSAQAAGMIDVRTMNWNYEVIDALGLDRAKLPPLVKPGEVVGTISAEIQQRTGLPADVLIVAGAGDQQAGALGAGVVSDGDVSITMGTGGFVIVGVRDPDFAGFKGLMVSSTPNLGVFEVEGNQNSGATCYRWVRDMVFSAEGQIARDLQMDPYTFMDEYVGRSRPGANGILFSAALFGTGYPTWNNDASGAFLGLKPTHTRGDLLRSVMEGVTLESRFMLEAVRDTGTQTNPLFTITGGATRSPIWRQVIADIMGTPCRTLDVEDAAVIGVAGLAAIGAGLLKDVHEVAAQMVHYKDTIEPIPANVAIYDRSFAAYKAAYHALNDSGVYALINDIYPKE